jgi:hypothetical protein
LGGTIISWNVPNWITIFLMAALGFFVLGMISQVAKQTSAAA